MSSSQQQQQQPGNVTYLPQPKPSSLASPTSLYSNSSGGGKNNPTSPVFVHSSMTPNSAGSATDSEGGSPMSCQRCVTSADTQSLSSSTSTQDSYKQRTEVSYTGFSPFLFCFVSSGWIAIAGDCRRFSCRRYLESWKPGSC